MTSNEPLKKSPAGTLRVSARKILCLLSVLIVLLVGLNLLVQYLKFFHGRNDLMGFYHLLNINGEANLPAWFSATQLALASLMCAVAAIHPKHREPGYARHWLLLSAALIFLSLDEAAYIHEHLHLHILNRLDVPGFMDHWWKIYLAGAFVLGLSLIKFLFSHLDKRTLWLMILSGAIFVTGAVLVEKFGSGYTIQHWGEESFAFMLSQTVEETLEMFGISLFIYAVIRNVSEGQTSIIVASFEQ